MKVAIYTRVSTHEQQSLPAQLTALRDYCQARRWTVVTEVADIASGASNRANREYLLTMARKRELDCIVVTRLDRWGRSLPDLITTLTELTELRVSFVSLTESLDLTTSAGRAMLGMLSVFSAFERDLLRERVKSGVAAARAQGKPHGRPASARKLKNKVQELFSAGVSKSAIARQLQIGRASVSRCLALSA